MFIIARFDSNGTWIDDRLLCDSLGAALAMAMNWSEIIATADGGYALTASHFDHHNGLFIKLRYDLSTEFIREYVDTINLVEFYNSIIELQDGYLLGGYVQSPNYLAEAFLRKVDKQGNSPWFSYYGEYAVSDLFSVYYKISDSLFACAGGYIENENILAGRGPWICVVNSTGEVVEEWRPDDNSPIDFIHGLQLVEPNSWVLYGINAVSGPPFKYRSFLSRIDA